MDKDWKAIWQKEIVERKEKLTQYLKKRERDIKILGDYLQSTMIKCKKNDRREKNEFIFNIFFLYQIDKNYLCSQDGPTFKYC